MDEYCLSTPVIAAAERSCDTNSTPSCDRTTSCSMLNEPAAIASSYALKECSFSPALPLCEYTCCATLNPAASSSAAAAPSETFCCALSSVFIILAVWLLFRARPRKVSHARHAAMRSSMRSMAISCSCRDLFLFFFFVTFSIPLLSVSLLQVMDLDIPVFCRRRPLTDVIKV